MCPVWVHKFKAIFVSAQAVIMLALELCVGETRRPYYVVSRIILFGHKIPLFRARSHCPLDSFTLKNIESPLGENLFMPSVAAVIPESEAHLNSEIRICLFLEL